MKTHIKFFVVTAIIFSSLLLFSNLCFAQKARGWSKTIHIQIDSNGYKIDTTFTTYFDDDAEEMLKEMERNLSDYFDMNFDFNFHFNEDMFDFDFDFPNFEEFEKNFQEMIDEFYNELPENNKDIRKEIEKRIKIDTNTVNINDKVIIKKNTDADKNTLNIEINLDDNQGDKTVTIKSNKQGKDTVITKSVKKVIVVNNDGTTEVIGDSDNNTIDKEKNTQSNKQKKIITSVCVKISDLDKKERENLKGNDKNIKFAKADEIDVDFYPNPNTGKFTLSFSIPAVSSDRDKKDEPIYYNNPKKEKTTIRIINLNGKEIYTENLGNFSGKYTKEIELPDKISGTYFLQIIHGKRALTKKIIVEQ